jgi:hypothetical protein
MLIHIMAIEERDSKINVAIQEGMGYGARFESLGRLLNAGLPDQ